MFRKILFFLLFTNLSLHAQKMQPDYECFNIDISEIDVDTRFLRDENDPELVRRFRVGVGFFCFGAI